MSATSGGCLNTLVAISLLNLIGVFMLQDDDFDDVDGLVGSCGMSFQIDAWERIKKELQGTRSTDNQQQKYDMRT